MSTTRFDGSRRSITFALVLCSALTSFESTVVSTAMPTIIGDLGGLGIYSWVFSVYLLTSTITMPLYGRLADLRGRRRLLLFAIGVFILGAFFCARAGTMAELIAARALQGFGAGGIVPLSLTVTADLYAIGERARIQALFSGIWGASSLIGPALGAALTIAFGWKSIFLVNLPLAGLAFVLVFLRLKESRVEGAGESPAESFDLAGGLLLASGIACLLASVMHGGAGGAAASFATMTVLALRAFGFVLGLALLAIFLRVEARRAHPLVDPTLLKRPEMRAPYVSAVLLGCLLFAIDAFVPLFVQGARGGSAGAAGAVVTPLMFCWALSATLGARAVVKFGFRKTARFGAFTLEAGLFLLIAAALRDAGVVWISAATAVIGLGLGPSSIAQVLAIQKTAEDRLRGIATSLVPFFRTTGGSLGVAALGGLLGAQLAARLGGDAETAGRVLAGDAVFKAAEAARFRLAIEQSLLPVFGLLVLVGLGCIAAASRFPAEVD